MFFFDRMVPRATGPLQERPAPIGSFSVKPNLVFENVPNVFLQSAVKEALARWDSGALLQWGLNRFRESDFAVRVEFQNSELPVGDSTLAFDVGAMVYFDLETRNGELRLAEPVQLKGLQVQDFGINWLPLKEIKVTPDDRVLLFSEYLDFPIKTLNSVLLHGSLGKYFLNQEIAPIPLDEIQSRLNKYFEETEKSVPSKFGSKLLGAIKQICVNSTVFSGSNAVSRIFSESIYPFPEPVNWIVNSLGFCIDIPELSKALSDKEPNLWNLPGLRSLTPDFKGISLHKIPFPEGIEPLSGTIDLHGEYRPQRRELPLDLKFNKAKLRISEWFGSDPVEISGRIRLVVQEDYRFRVEFRDLELKLPTFPNRETDQASFVGKLRGSLNFDLKASEPLQASDLEILDFKVSTNPEKSLLVAAFPWLIQGEIGGHLKLKYRPETPDKTLQLLWDVNGDLDATPPQNDSELLLKGNKLRSQGQLSWRNYQENWYPNMGEANFSASGEFSLEQQGKVLSNIPTFSINYQGLEVEDPSKVMDSKPEDPLPLANFWETLFKNHFTKQANIFIGPSYLKEFSFLPIKPHVTSNPFRDKIQELLFGSPVAQPSTSNDNFAKHKIIQRGGLELKAEAHVGQFAWKPYLSLELKTVQQGSDFEWNARGELQVQDTTPQWESRDGKKIVPPKTNLKANLEFRSQSGDVLEWYGSFDEPQQIGEVTIEEGGINIAGEGSNFVITTEDPLSIYLSGQEILAGLEISGESSPEQASFEVNAPYILEDFYGRMVLKPVGDRLAASYWLKTHGPLAEGDGWSLGRAKAQGTLRTPTLNEMLKSPRLFVESQVKAQLKTSDFKGPIKSQLHFTLGYQPSLRSQGVRGRREKHANLQLVFKPDRVSSLQLGPFFDRQGKKQSEVNAQWTGAFIFTSLKDRWVVGGHRVGLTNGVIKLFGIEEPALTDVSIVAPLLWGIEPEIIHGDSIRVQWSPNKTFLDQYSDGKLKLQDHPKQFFVVDRVPLSKGGFRTLLERSKLKTKTPSQQQGKQP